VLFFFFWFSFLFSFFCFFSLDIKESDQAVNLLSIDELTGAAVIPEIPHIEGKNKI
jgi:hypothetical protein